MNPGDIVFYHLNGSAKEGVDGQAVVARVVRAREDGSLDIVVEGSDLQKSHVPKGTGPGHWEAYVMPAEELTGVKALMDAPLPPDMPARTAEEAANLAAMLAEAPIEGKKLKARR